MLLRIGSLVWFAPFAILHLLWEEKGRDRPPFCLLSLWLWTLFLSVCLSEEENSPGERRENTHPFSLFLLVPCYVEVACHRQLCFLVSGEVSMETPSHREDNFILSFPSTSLLFPFPPSFCPPPFPTTPTILPTLLPVTLTFFSLSSFPNYPPPNATEKRIDIVSVGE